MNIFSCLFIGIFFFFFNLSFWIKYLLKNSCCALPEIYLEIRSAFTFIACLELFTGKKITTLYQNDFLCSSALVFLSVLLGKKMWFFF